MLPNNAMVGTVEPPDDDIRKTPPDCNMAHRVRIELQLTARGPNDAYTSGGVCDYALRDNHAPTEDASHTTSALQVHGDTGKLRTSSL